MRPFENAVRSELSWLVRAGVPPRALRISVRELVVAHITHEPIGPREVEDTVESAVRAACRLVRELDAPDEIVETVCRAALEAVRGHGGESARWLAGATSAASDVVDEMARDHAEEPMWSWLARRLERW